MIVRLEYGSLFPEGEREVQMARARAAGLAFVDLDRVRIEPETRALIPAELA